MTPSRTAHRPQSQARGFWRWVPLFLLCGQICLGSGKGSLSGDTDEAVADPGRGVRIELAGASFEEAQLNWEVTGAAELVQLSAEAAFDGAQGLRLDSPVDDGGLKVTSGRISVQPGISYRLNWRARVLGGLGTNAVLVFYDGEGAVVQRDEGRVNAEKGNGWVSYQLDAVPPPGAVALAVQIARPGFRPAKYRIDFDEFELNAMPIPLVAPWPGTYKLRPDETDRLTAADVVGPDGRVYPDWTWAGVPGGIPTRPVKVSLAELGAKPGQDIAALLEQAAGQVAAQGGGAIEVGEGEYFLDQPVMIFSDNVVIRGAGQDKTRLLFRYHVPLGEIRFFRIKEGDTLGRLGSIEFHANTKDLAKLELRAGDKMLSRRLRADHWGNTFSLRMGVRQAIEALGEGPHTITAVAEYGGGRRVERSIELNLSVAETGDPAPVQLGAINFVGRGAVSGQKPLVSDVRRGDRVITLAEGHGLAEGERISLVAPASERWKALVGHTSHWNIQAQGIYAIEAVEGGEVTLHQPVRTEFLVGDGSYAQRLDMISGSGVEHLYLEQLVVPNQGPRGPIIRETIWHAIEDLWTSGVIYSNAWGCWMQGITVRKTGRNSAYFPMSKHIEIRDCIFDDAIFKGGGGTGYIGFDRTWDSLMDNVEARGMRHAPNNQWNASGNVVRKSRFHGSDGQWHAGWTLENLYENNFIDARGKGGSYGHGLYASGPTSGIHGPQGPRNVVYNNDVVSRLDGLHMLGSNEGWMILHNRFVVGSGRAVYAKEKSFDHIIDGNVFVLRQGKSPAVFIGSDGTGVELTNNVFYGATSPLVGFAGGMTRLARDEGNVLHAEVPDLLPDRPRPETGSIYQWQKDHQDTIRAASAERAAARALP